MKNVFKSLALIILISLYFSPIVQGADDGFNWPIEIETDEGLVITLYQPQLESFNSNILEGRMAVTIKPKDKDLIFGALWFESTVSTDTENRTVSIAKMHIAKTHFPEMMDEEKKTRFSEYLSAEVESRGVEMSLDRFTASLAEIDNIHQISAQINNDPPEIYFRTHPAVLLMIDGEPITKKDEESGLEYIVNTPFFIVKDPKKGDYYINGGPFWYTSKEITKNWEETNKVPSKVKKFAKKQNQETEKDSVAQSFKEAPELIVETQPAELISVDGDIDYKPIEGTNLLYVFNSENDIIMEINSQNHYILLAGRWYYSKSLDDGDWTFSEPDKLPEDFKKIPADSDMESVRASIPGTSEAQIALLEQSIPQTATIDRKDAKVEVAYDGDAKFEKIEGTDISYALNTDKTVLLINNVLYCIDDAVWFQSDKATGPWEVCVEIPNGVDQIPPSSPVYNVTYTYIYESTPEVVYVGYLPGYTYSYVYGGVVVYGTGFYYHPWYGHHYYPRAVTWGYGVHYNPYTGWGFSVGISYGWVSWGFHPYRRSYWGRRGYYRGYRHGYARGYSHGRRAGYRAGYNAGRYNANRNVYNNRNTGVNRTANRTNNVNNKARTTGKSNNMYTDKGGNVYQRDKKSGNYQNKSNNQTRQSQPSTSQKQQLNKSQQSRNQGTQNYNRSTQQRSSPSRSGGGGGRRR